MPMSEADPDEGLTPEEIAALDRLDAEKKTKPGSSPEWRLLAKFGKHFGWPAIEAALDNRVAAATMVRLVEEADMIDMERSAMNVIDHAEGVGAAMSKNPGRIIRSARKERGL